MTQYLSSCCGAHHEPHCCNYCGRQICPACAEKDEALKDIAEINKAIGKERDELLEIREQRNRELVEKDAEIARLKAENENWALIDCRKIQQQLTTLKSAVREYCDRYDHQLLMVGGMVDGPKRSESFDMLVGLKALVAEPEAHESKKA